MKKDVQDTSLDAYYNEIVPTIGKRQRQVFQAIKELGCPTDMEIAKHLHVEIRSVGARRNELMHMKKIILGEKRKCTITNRNAMAWKIKGIDLDDL